MNVKPVQVRLPREAYDALSAYAYANRITLGGAARTLLEDHILGRARGLAVPESRRRGGFVYVIRVGELCKIGKADNVDARLRHLNLPSTPEVVATKYSAQPLELERKVHRAFAHVRERGEWFRLSEADIARARAMLKA